MDPEKKPVEVYAEKGETKLPEASAEELKALASAYAKYLAEHDIKPGEPTFTDSLPVIETPEEPQVSVPADEPEELKEADTAEESKAEETPAAKDAAETPEKQKRKKAKIKASRGDARKMFAAAELSQEQIAALAAELEKTGKKPGFMARAIDTHDILQFKADNSVKNGWQNFVIAAHRLTSTYRQSRRVIGIALLLIGILAAVILAIFDKYTVYEYAYNGKTLGYVSNQEDVTDVLDIAGTMLTENSSGNTEIRFTANQNVTFNLVDSRGKSIDDADTAINKLVYMTDIETEAFGVYDGDDLAAVVKSNEDAEELLAMAKQGLSVPDKGMSLVSADFSNQLDIRPVNVLLTSVQSNHDAYTLMTEGGKMEIYHIVEEGETPETLSQSFSVEQENIFDEYNSDVATEIMQGDMVCIHKEVEPVSVKMVETGRMRETIEYDTIKKESDKYYKGDTYTKQEGVDGIQIFEGTITKIGGNIARRDARSIEKIREKKDKIILIGTAERPKTAPTGTYAMPIDHYTLSSNFGYRWGRLHAGIDMAAPTGTPIYASDGGTVTRAGWYSGYGLCVDIDHGNGRETRYGHCSKILVNVGDQVYQGQVVSLVGNTGHSFGSHLHFEIHRNGTPINPRPILGI